MKSLPRVLSLAAVLLVCAIVTTVADGSTALRNAVRANDQEKVKSLLALKDTDLNGQNKYGQTALHIAASRGHQDIAVLLIAHGADVSVRDEDGETPFDFAARKGHKEVANLLHSKGPGATTESKSQAASHYVRSGVIILSVVACIIVVVLILKRPAFGQPERQRVAPISLPEADSLLPTSTPPTVSERVSSTAVPRANPRKAGAPISTSESTVKSPGKAARPVSSRHKETEEKHPALRPGHKALKDECPGSAFFDTETLEKYPLLKSLDKELLAKLNLTPEQVLSMLEKMADEPFPGLFHDKPSLLGKPSPLDTFDFNSGRPDISATGRSLGSSM